jgi:tetratricopeptide (TPR) repeat protein
VVGETDNESVTEPTPTEQEIERSIVGQHGRYTTLNLLRLIPAELWLTSIVLMLVGVSIALWTARIVNRDAVERYGEESLWQLRSAHIQEQADYLDQEKALRQNLLSAAQKSGPEYIASLIAFGEFYLRNGKWDLAAGCFENVLKTVKSQGRDAGSLGPVYLALGKADLEMGKIEDSIHYLLLARQASTSSQADDEEVLKELVAAYSQNSNLVAAKKACRTLLDILSTDKRNTAVQAFWECQLADIERRMKDGVGAERLYRQALIDLAQQPAAAGGDLARARFGLAIVCAEQGDSAEAERNFKQAIAQAEKSEGPDSQLLQSIRRAYAYTLWKTNWIAAAALTFVTGDKHHN